MAVLKMRGKFDLKILEKVGSQTLTNSDYTKQQLNVIIDCIEFCSSPLIVLRLLLLFTGVFENSPENSREF